MAKFSDAGEDAALWKARISTFQEMWKDGEAEREAFKRALDNGPDAFEGFIEIYDGEGNRIQPVVLNFFSRLRSRLEGHCFDESPENTYPREAAGDEKIADGISRFASRISEEAGLPFEYRDGITSLMIAGGFGIVYGMPNIPTAEVVDERAKGTDQLLMDAAQGQAAPVPGQDHDTAATVMTEVASDHINLLANPPEVTQNIFEGAAAHLAAKEDEDKKGIFWNRKEDMIYSERVELGSHLAYDTTYGDHRKARWVAHKIEMPGKEARKHPAFAPRVRSRLVPSLPSDEKEAEKFGVKFVRVEGMSDEEHLEENGLVQIWCVYDRKWKKRHFIPWQLKDGELEYLEADDKNPYLDDNGDPLLPWFWPIEIFIYRRSTRRGPRRAFPIPYMRDGWDQQIESIKFDTMLLEGTKAAMSDKYLADEGIDDETMEALTNSRVHVVVKKPSGVENAKDAIAALQFKPPLQEAWAERRNQQDRFCIAVNFPIGQFTSQPQADTLGQEEMGVSSGNDQTADVTRMLEVSYSRVVMGMLYIAAAKVPTEVVAEYMGPGMEQVWEGWRQTSLRGDMIRTKFAPTTREQNPVRAKQLMDLVAVCQTLTNPTTGLPLVKPSTTFSIFNEACKAMGVGAVEVYEPTPEEMAMMAALMNGGGGGESQNGESGGRDAQQTRERPNRKPEGSQQRGKGPPGRGQVSAGARRAT